ncbi:MAG: glycoside hydrolase family 36 protein [Thermomicrobiales bacterium]
MTVSDGRVTRQSITIEAAGTAMTVTAATDTEVTLRAETESVESGVDGCVIHLTIETEPGRRFELHELSLEWTVPIVDMHGLYFGGNPRTELFSLPFWQFEKTICANTGLPFLALIHRTGENRFAFGLADQLTETRLQAHLSEATRCYHFTVRKPVSGESGAGGIPVTGCWQEVVFVSRNTAPWSEVLRQYTTVVDGSSKEPAMPVSEVAFAPVFCSWTAIHHDVSHDWVMRQAPLAAELGFGTWLTDDGWFIEEGRFADYGYAGDWEPCAAKFPDFKAHVAAVQDLGLRYVLWVAPFMVGKESQAARRYQHLLIPGQARERFDNLSPWQPETKQIVADLLKGLVAAYGLDGLKIDFLDAVTNHGSRPLGADGASFGERLYRILADAVDQVLHIRPDLLIEFRNSYTNLASRRYANLYRSSDVPLNFTLNRWQVVMLRLLAPDRAVHLDPALWHPNDTDDNVAVHLINCLVGVPMVSIELDRYPRSHLDLIRHWIGFYNEHRRTLIHGAFKPALHLGHVPAIYFASEEETIAALYDDVPLKLDPAPRLSLLNASTRPYVEISGGGLEGAYQVVERDKFGRLASEQDVVFPQAHLDVEVGGCVELVPR